MASSRKPAAGEGKVKPEENSQYVEWLIKICNDSQKPLLLLNEALEQWAKQGVVIEQLIQSTLNSLAKSRDKSTYLNVRDALCEVGKLSQKEAGKADKLFNSGVPFWNRQGKVEPYRPPSPARSPSPVHSFNQPPAISSAFTTQRHAQIDVNVNQDQKKQGFDINLEKHMNDLYDSDELTDKQLVLTLQLFQSADSLAQSWMLKNNTQHVSDSLSEEQAKAALQNINNNLKSIGIQPDAKVLAVQPSQSDPTRFRVALLDIIALRSSLEGKIDNLKSLLEDRANDKNLPQALQAHYQALRRSIDSEVTNEAKHIQSDSSPSSPKPYRK